MAVADGRRGIRHVFLRDLVLQASVGVYREEQGRTQRLRINVDLGVTEGAMPPSRLEEVVDYAVVAERVRALVLEGHTALVETLAERVAAACLLDGRVVLVRVRVEKLDAIRDAGSVGIEIERVRFEACPPVNEGR